MSQKNPPRERDVFEKAKHAAKALRSEAAQWKGLYERERKRNQILREAVSDLRSHMWARWQDVPLFGVRGFELGEWCVKASDAMFNSILSS